MPIYSYRCDKCLKDVEIIKTISKSEDHETCPLCHEIMAKQLTTGSFTIKGYSYQNGYEGY